MVHIVKRVVVASPTSNDVCNNDNYNQTAQNWANNHWKVWLSKIACFLRLWTLGQVWPHQFYLERASHLWYRLSSRLLHHRFRQCLRWMVEVELPIGLDSKCWSHLHFLGYDTKRSISTTKATSNHLVGIAISGVEFVQVALWKSCNSDFGIRVREKGIISRPKGSYC